MRKEYLKIIFFLLFIFVVFCLGLIFTTEGYSNIELLALNPAPDSENIESSDYYQLDDKYVQGNYPQTSKIDLLTYNNDTLPSWPKFFKWC